MLCIFFVFTHSGWLYYIINTISWSGLVYKLKTTSPSENVLFLIMFKNTINRYKTKDLFRALFRCFKQCCAFHYSDYCCHQQGPRGSHFPGGWLRSGGRSFQGKCLGLMLQWQLLKSPEPATKQLLDSLYMFCKLSVLSDSKNITFVSSLINFARCLIPPNGNVQLLNY